MNIIGPNPIGFHLTTNTDIITIMHVYVTPAATTATWHRTESGGAAARRVRQSA